MRTVPESRLEWLGEWEATLHNSSLCRPTCLSLSLHRLLPSPTHPKVEPGGLELSLPAWCPTPCPAPLLPANCWLVASVCSQAWTLVLIGRKSVRSWPARPGLLGGKLCGSWQGGWGSQDRRCPWGREHAFRKGSLFGSDE